MTGATGQFAGLVLPKFKQSGHRVFALVQNEAKGKEALFRGADRFVVGNLYEPGSLATAIHGMEAVFHIIPAFQREVEAGVNMVAAARDAGVRKFVFSSVYHPSLSLVNHADKRPAEEALYLSGMDYTILQPAMYMQMLGQAYTQAMITGSITMPYSIHSKMSYVDYRDVAKAAALSMIESRLSYGTFELCSPGMYNRIDLAAMMSNKLGRHIVASEISPGQWMKQAKIPPGSLRDGLFAMNTEYDRYGFSGGNSLVLETILREKPRTVAGYINELN